MARPNYFSEFDLDALKRQEQAKKAGVSEEEISLNELSYSGGWKILSEMIENMKTELDGAILNAVSAGQNFEDIGRTTVAASITKEMLTRLVNRVADAREAVKRHQPK